MTSQVSQKSVMGLKWAVLVNQERGPEEGPLYVSVGKRDQVAEVQVEVG